MSPRSRTIHVLLVSPFEEDHRTLKDILRGSKWSLHQALDLSSALTQIRRTPSISLIVCESNLLPDTWKDLWASLSAAPDPPVLVVACHCADAQLWADVLDRGAYDVLSTPFETAEVVRSLNMGWLHKRSRDCPPLAVRASSAS